MKEFLLFCSLIVQVLFIGAFWSRPSVADDYNNIASIWNPSSVEWWVSEGDENDNVCQVHWLFDDVMDIYFKKHADRYYYFGVDNQGFDAFDKFSNAGTFSAFLVVGDNEVDLGVARVDNGNLVVVTPPNINVFEYLRDSKVLLLKSEQVLYNFPLENSKENFTVYETCLRDTGQYQEPVSEMDVLQVERVLETSPNVEPDMSTGPSYQPPPLFGGETVVEEPVMGTQVEKAEVAQVESLELQPQEVNEEPLQKSDIVEESSVIPQMITKQSDRLAEDLEIIGGPIDEKERQKKTKTPKYDSKSTAIIRNMTRKLAVLEKEKESLRLRLMASNKPRIVSDILSCRAEESEPVIEVESLSSDLVAEFEQTIENLRAENELLNAAIVNKVPDMPGVEAAADMVSLKDKIVSLNKKVNELELENADLTKSVEGYRSAVGEVQKSDEIPDSQIEKARQEADDYDFDETLKAAKEALKDDVPIEGVSEEAGNVEEGKDDSSQGVDVNQLISP